MPSDLLCFVKNPSVFYRQFLLYLCEGFFNMTKLFMLLPFLVSLLSVAGSSFIRRGDDLDWLNIAESALQVANLSDPSNNFTIDSNVDVSNLLL